MSQVNGSKIRLAVAGTLAFASAGQVAVAADAPIALEEITVTAEKRTSTVQETPISIAAFSGEELAKAGVDGSYGLANLTPGLTIQKEVIGKVVIRGVGTENYTVGSDPGVAIHKDGAYMARSSVSIFDFFDLERVEVLRGPQGTLYGRNASGGVINIISNAPTETFEGYARLDVGNYARLRAEAAVSGPVADTVQGRLSVLYAERDGYSDNVFPGLPAAPGNATGYPGYSAISDAKSRNVDQLDNQDLWAVRAQANIDFSESVSLLLQGEWSRDDSLPPAFKYFDLSNVWWLGAFGPDQDLPDIRKVAQGFETEIPGTDRTVPSVGQANQDAYQAKLTWDIGDMTFTSLSAYRSIDFSWINDGDGFDAFFVTYFQTDESEQFTQEFQLSSSDDSALQWILGAYYLTEDATTFTGIPFLFPVFAAPYILWDGKSDTEAYALFGQATYAFTDRLRVTAGLRYNKEDKKGDLVYNRFGGLVQPDVAIGEPPGTTWSDVLDKSWDATTGKLAIDYDFTDDMMGYASVARGFKSGGFNLLAAQAPYDPETLWAYELGLKTRWADGRVIANFGAFLYDYEDMQVGKVVNLSATVVNAAASTIQGLEAEVRALVGAGFEIDAGLSYLDTSYDEFETEDPAWPGGAGCGKLIAAPRTISLKGCELPRAPDFQGVLGISWSTAVGNGGELRMRGDYSYRGDQYFTQFNRDVVSQDGYGLLGARITYTAPDAKWYVTAYGENLADEDYWATVLESGVAAEGTVVPQAVVGAPQTYGLTVGFNF
jgi:iron complex outermembrane receptor protein